MTTDHLMYAFVFIGVMASILFAFFWMCLAARICWAYFNYCVRRAIEQHELLKHIKGIPKP